MTQKNKQALSQFKSNVMKQYGYHVNASHPEDIKYEVAEEVGVPLKKGYNGDIEAKNAGKIGGNIGGKMVREMIRMAQQNLKNNQ